MLHPPIFYKYTSSSTALRILENSRLRWSSPVLFNDVAEFQRMPCFDPTVADAHRLVPEAITSAIYDGGMINEACLAPRMRDVLNLARSAAANGLEREGLLHLLTREAPDADDRIEGGLRAHFQALDVRTARVLCVTAEYDNDVLWGNYAEAHAGCALGFKHIVELSTPLLAAQPVDYSESNPVVGSGLDFVLYGDTDELRKRTLQAVFYTKKLAWSYEREWRALTWRPNEQNKEYSDYHFYSQELESVTLGVRASATTEIQVLELLQKKYQSATLYRMKAKNGELTRYKISSDPIIT